MEFPNTKTLFRGKRINVLSVDERFEVVDHPGAVVILPFLDDATVVLIRNRRQAVQEVLWELPAGTLEAGEEPLACAFRELEEETGYRAQQMTHLFDCYSTPGFCNEKLYFFKAQQLTHIGQNLDVGEDIEVVPTPFSEALAMIKSGAICDAKTIAALLYGLSM